MRGMEKLSQYLLKLSKGAIAKHPNEFQDLALSEAKDIIQFDSCVWGNGNWVNDTPVVHNVHLYNLKGNFIESWMRFQHEDKLIREATKNNNRTINSDLARDFENTNLYNIFCKEFCLEHVLSTASIDPDTQILSTIVIYRSGRNQPFTEDERSLQEILFQHLIEAARINWLTNLPNIFSTFQHCKIGALASCSHDGILYMAMPSFVELCGNEWASWKGPFLPAELVTKIGESKTYMGQSIVINSFHENGIILLRARKKAPADQLSSRELKVAEKIADGDDYKTIAQDLGISPATVKSHIANIFIKLGINNKSKLSIELAKISI